jgi:hypothetical protein
MRLHKRYHRRVNTKAYKRAIVQILKRYDPDRHITPCDPFSDPWDQGIGRALRDIADAINRGRFPF